MRRLTSVPMAPMRGDPPIREDGRCFKCNKPRPKVAERNFDPFCSTECARWWWEQPAEVRADLVSDGRSNA